MRTQSAKTKTAARPATNSAPQPAPAEQKLRALAPIQQFICDEVADMIVNGGYPEDLHGLVFAAVSNSYRRAYGDLKSDPAEAQQFVEEMTRKNVAAHKSELLAILHQNRKAAPDKTIEPKTAAERLRTVLLDTLERDFAHFLRDATPEERWNMHEILTNHESINRGSGDLDALPLAQAFDFQLGKAAPQYVKVPEEMQHTVEQYIEALKAAKVKDRK